MQQQLITQQIIMLRFVKSRFAKFWSFCYLIKKITNLMMKMLNFTKYLFPHVVSGLVSRMRYNCVIRYDKCLLMYVFKCMQVVYQCRQRETNAILWFTMSLVVVSSRQKKWRDVCVLMSFVWSTFSPFAIHEWDMGAISFRKLRKKYLV